MTWGGGEAESDKEEGLWGWQLQMETKVFAVNEEEKRRAEMEEKDFEKRFVRPQEKPEKLLQEEEKMAEC